MKGTETGSAKRGIEMHAYNANAVMVMALSRYLSRKVYYLHTHTHTRVDQNIGINIFAFFHPLLSLPILLFFLAL